MRLFTMESAMKEEIRKSNALGKTEDAFVFDDDLVAGPILSALIHLDSPTDEEGQNEFILMSSEKC